MFTTTRTIRFGDVDGASIVFYPRYVGILSDAIEEWMESLDWSFRRLHVEFGLGIPTVKLDVEFSAPSRLGDVIEIGIKPTRIGSRSCTLAFEMRLDEEARLQGSITVVCVDLKTIKSMPWPKPLLDQITAQVPT